MSNIPQVSVLYKHWNKCQQDPRDQKYKMVSIDSKLEQDFWDFILERMNIFYKKDAGTPFPWTQDPILSKNKFCNVYRELDKTTIALHKLAAPVLHDLELTLLNFFYMRWIGLPNIIEQIGLLDFSETTLKNALEKFNSIEGTKWTSAYNAAHAGIISTGVSTRQEFLFDFLPKRIKQIAAIVSSKYDWAIIDLVEAVVPLVGFGARFMSMEVLMDVGYQFPEYINEFNKVFVGPGAVPSAKAFNQKAEATEVIQTLMHTQPIDEINALIIRDNPVFITASNLENCSCEFRKYSNLMNGTGLKGKKPRSRLYKV